MAAANDFPRPVLAAAASAAMGAQGNDSSPVADTTRAPITPEAEEWRPIPGHQGAYEVSDLGRVRSLARTVVCAHASGKTSYRRYRSVMLRPAVTRGGHLSVVLGRATGSKSVHALVLLAFIGPPPEGCETLHRDGDPANNRLSNLRYGTRSQNLIDVFYHTGRRLTREQVLHVRLRATEGFYYGERYQLALAWGVNPGVIWNILSDRAYAHVR